MKNKIFKILRWSEKYTKTDMVYLTEGGFWLVMGQIITIMSSLITVVAFANLLPKEAYGNYQFVMSLAAIVSGISLTGMSTAMTRTIARGKSGILKFAFKKQMIWGIGITISSGIIAAYYFANGNNILGTSMLIVGLFSPLLDSFGLYRSYLRGRQLFKESSLIGLWHRPIPAIAMVIALFSTNNPVILVFVYYMTNTLVVWFLYKKINKKYKEDYEEDSDLLNYSKHLSVIGLFGRIANNLDTILVFHFLGASIVSIYTIALMPTNRIIQALNLSRDLVSPKFAIRNFEELRSAILGKAFRFLLVSIVIIILYVLAAPYIFKLLFPSYMEAVLPSQILILILLAKPLLLYNQVFESQRMRGAQYFIQISTPVVKLVLLCILLPKYFLWGAVLSLLITHVYSIVTILLIFYSKKVNNYSS